MHKLVTFLLGCVVGYMLNECVDSVVGSLPNERKQLPLPWIEGD